MRGGAAPPRTVSEGTEAEVRGAGVGGGWHPGRPTGGVACPRVAPGTGLEAGSGAEGVNTA